MSGRACRWWLWALAPALTLSSAASGQPVIGPQVRIDVGGGTWAANETSAAASELNPLEIVAAWNDWRRSTPAEIINMGVAVSNDGGQTWTDFLVRPPAANQSNVEGDPMTAFDNRTGTLWVGAISFAANGGVYVARKNPGANTFQPSVMARATGGADKCWMAAGPLPGMPNTTRLYIAYNQGVLRSDDLGQTWAGPVSLGAGLGFLPRVGPNGELYVSYWNGSNLNLLRRSLDGGVTFSAPITIATRMDVWGTQDGSRFPGTFRVPSIPYIAVDPRDGTLYCVYFDTTNTDANGRNVDLYFTKSTNQGNTWTTPRVINGDTSPAGDQFFPWLEVDRRGRIHMVFYDARGIIQLDNTVNGMFNTYYAYSDDGGATWVESRLTPVPWNSNNDGLNRANQFIGDYNGAALAGDWFFPVYLDTHAGDPDIYTHKIISECAGDIDLDGDVDQADLGALLASYGLCGGGPPYDPRANIDRSRDGCVGQSDLGILLANYGHVCR